MTPSPVPVVGVRHAAADYPWALFDLAREVRGDAVEPVTALSFWDAPAAVSVEDRVRVELVREPDNPVDPHAVRVEVPVLERWGDHRHVGYVPADLARVYAGRMDRGLVPAAWVREVPVGSPMDMRPGLVIFVDWPDHDLTV